MRLGDAPAAVVAFEGSVRANNEDPVAIDHLMLAIQAAGGKREARRLAEQRVAKNPTALVPRALLALETDASLTEFAREARTFVGEDDFELLEASLAFAELGLFEQAGQIVREACVNAVPPDGRSFMPLYYLAWYESQAGDKPAALRWLAEAEETLRERVFASRPEEVEIFRYALAENPDDAQAHLHLGCLLANLGRLDEAHSHWKKATESDASMSIAWRNLGLAAATQDDLAKADTFYRKAIAARPSDQTLYRDLAEILIAADRRREAIRLLETMPSGGMRRAEITLILAQSYVEEERYQDCVSLLESTPYFVNWEGQDVTWKLFNEAHIGRGRQRLEKDDARGALAHFEAALTYPDNLNVGRPDKPEEAPAQYWRGQALARLGRTDEARTAWQAGADGADLPEQQNEFRQKCREALEK
jgi:tetratricopeptide (TPR) repeat protein